MNRPDRPRVDEPVLTAREPADLLAVVPYRLGFHPQRSLVLLALDGPRRRFGFAARVDLPPLAAVPQLARYLVQILQRHGAEGVLLVAYAADDDVAGPLVGTLRQWLPRAGVELVDAYRADGRRWFCYTCDHTCCPDDGTPYDLSDHPLVAEHVLAGQVALPDREALREQVASVAGPRRKAMTSAFGRVRRETAAAPGEDTGRLADRVDWVRSRVDAWVVGEDRVLSDDEAARLAVSVSAIPVRDAAWMMMARDTAQLHRELWQTVLTRVVPPYEPAVACLTAFAAWLEGHGALAWCAVERALAADPDYSWAGLIVESLEQALSPAVWEELRPEQIPPIDP